jgi:hypothetical protein
VCEEDILLERLKVLCGEADAFEVAESRIDPVNDLALLQALQKEGATVTKLRSESLRNDEGPPGEDGFKSVQCERFLGEVKRSGH